VIAHIWTSDSTIVGLEIRDPALMNIAMREKVLWRLVKRKITWWKKYFKGGKQRCSELPPKDTKCSAIFKLIKVALPLINEKLTWIPGNDKRIRIWQDNICGKDKLYAQKNFSALQDWMSEHDINTLYDISQWDETAGNWVG